MWCIIMYSLYVWCMTVWCWGVQSSAKVLSAVIRGQYHLFLDLCWYSKSVSFRDPYVAVENKPYSSSKRIHFFSLWYVNNNIPIDFWWQQTRIYYLSVYIHHYTCLAIISSGVWVVCCGQSWKLFISLFPWRREFPGHTNIKTGSTSSREPDWLTYRKSNPCIKIVLLSITVRTLTPLPDTLGART